MVQTDNQTTTTFTVRINHELARELQRLADSDNRSRNNYIETVLQRHVDAQRSA
jgi:predicted transcriptional regulator